VRTRPLFAKSKETLAPRRVPFFTRPEVF